MSTTSRTNYYANGREPTPDVEFVQIFSRPKIIQANYDTDEGKIHAFSGNIEAIAEHSEHEDRDTQEFRDEIRTTMFSTQGLEGDNMVLTNAHSCE